MCLPVSNSSRLKTSGSVGILSNSSSSSLSTCMGVCVYKYHHSILILELSQAIAVCVVMSGQDK